MFGHAQDLGRLREPLGVHEGVRTVHISGGGDFGFEEGKESGVQEGFKSLKSQKDAKPQAAGSEIRNLKFEIRESIPVIPGTMAAPIGTPGLPGLHGGNRCDKLGGLIDFAILGGADNHVAHALIGNAKASLPGSPGSRYAEHILRWEERAERHIRRNIGVVPGLIQPLLAWASPAILQRKRWSILLGDDPGCRTSI